MTHRSPIHSELNNFSTLLGPAKVAAFALTLAAPSGPLIGETLASAEPLRSTTEPRWNLVWKDAQHCHVVDVGTGETTLGSLDVIKGQFSNETARHMVRLVGPWPEELKAMLTGKAAFTRPEMQNERVELRSPTQQDAREHAHVLVTSARAHELKVIEATPTRCTVMANGVQFSFDVMNDRGCVVSAPGLGPYKLNDISYRDIYLLMTNPAGAKQDEDQEVPPKVQEHIVTDPGDLPADQGVVQASPELAQSLRATLSEYCRNHPLKDEHFSSGVLSLLIETPLGEACFILVNREEKTWSVSVEGHGDTTMSGMPYSVAARLFEREGKLELASAMAQRAGIRLEEKVGSRASDALREASSDSLRVDEQSRISGGVVMFDEHYNIRDNCAHITPSELEENLRGVLRGKGALLVQEAQKYHLCPLAFAAITAHESDNGRSDLAINKNNVFGIWNEQKKESRSFDSVEECIRYSAKLLGSYCDEEEPRQTISEIQQKYAPLKVANDPKNLNRHWRSGVVRWMRTLGGSDRLSPPTGLAAN